MVQYAQKVKAWKLTLEYDGTKYSGWQEQKNARSIMGELRKAAEDCLGLPVELQGSGRTDAGVHAAAQVAHMKAKITAAKPPLTLLRELNDRLPADIVVLAVEPASLRFHARHDARTRSYVYQISIRKTAFSKRYVWWVKEALNVEVMTRAAKALEGRHDFTCFRALDAARPNESTIVVVEKAEIERQEDLIVFRIEASHFLWRMVRRVVGVLVKLGTGELAYADFEKLLDGQCQESLPVAAWTAPASGLFLESVQYPENR